MEGYGAFWKAYEEVGISHSAAHYLLAIEELGREGEGPRAADVARGLGVSRAAVSLALKSLTRDGLVEVGEDHRLRLTAAGREVVARVASKRRVFAAFLAEVLGLPAEKAEAEACKVEHLLSTETAAAMVRFLRFARSSRTRGPLALSEFRDLTANCEPASRCDLCMGTCLLRQED